MNSSTIKPEYYITEPFKFGYCPQCGAIGKSPFSCARNHTYQSAGTKLLVALEQDVFIISMEECEKMISFLNACGSNAYKYDKKITVLSNGQVALAIAAFPLVHELAKMHLARIRVDQGKEN